jgi:hypothetical protein
LKNFVAFDDAEKFSHKVAIYPEFGPHILAGGMPFKSRRPNFPRRIWPGAAAASIPQPNPHAGQLVPVARILAECHPRTCTTGLESGLIDTQHSTSLRKRTD